MAKKVLCIGSGGIGDCILSLQCAFYAQRKHGKESVDVLLCARDTVFQPILHFFGDKFNILQHPDKEKPAENYDLVLKPELLSPYKDLYEEVYYNCPDTLFRNPYSFDYVKYQVSHKIIKQTRLLTDKFEGVDSKRVYVGLVSSTDGYIYSNIGDLIKRLALNLRAYQFYFPKVSVWGGRDDLEHLYGNLEDMPPNVYIHENPDINESFKFMQYSCLGIYSCNGASHVSHQFGQPRILLDPQFDRAPWLARWKETGDELIPINTSIPNIVDLVTANLYNPETQLLPNLKTLKIIQKNGGYCNTNWNHELLLKF